MSKQPKAKREAADESYHLATCHAVRKLETLRSLLGDHHTDAYQGKRGPGWDHVGDLNHLNELLQEAIEFLQK